MTRPSPEYFNNNERLILASPKDRLLHRTAERVIDAIGSLKNSKSQLAKEDGHLYERLITGQIVGFKGFWFYEEIPGPEQPDRGREIFLTTFVSDLGETAWIIAVGCKWITRLSDYHLQLALTHESEHARSNIKEIEREGKLHRISEKEKWLDEVDAEIHSIEVYRDLRKYDSFPHDGVFEYGLQELETIEKRFSQKPRVMEKKKRELAVVFTILRDEGMFK